MKNILLPAFILLLSTSLFAQQNLYEPLWREKAKEGFDNLPKGAVRKEMACFVIAGEGEKNSFLKPGRTVVISSGENYIAFKRENILVTIKGKSFDSTQHRIKRDEDGFVAAIDGKPVYGRDGELPATIIQSVQVIIDEDTLRLPRTAFANLFEPTLYARGDSADAESPQVYISNDKRRVYIYTQHSDAAGAYEVTWIIQDRKYLRRVVDGVN